MPPHCVQVLSAVAEHAAQAYPPVTPMPVSAAHVPVAASLMHGLLPPHVAHLPAALHVDPFAHWGSTPVAHLFAAVQQLPAGHAVASVLQSMSAIGQVPLGVHVVPALQFVAVAHVPAVPLLAPTGTRQ